MAERFFKILTVGWLVLSPLRLQADTLLPPPNIILPNYDRTLVGKIPSLEAGAYGTRVNDASVNWYNPAGLMHSEKTVINASTSAYRWTGITAETASIQTGSSSGSTPPSFLGVIIGSPVIGSDRYRVGFSITNETFWSPILQNQLTDTTPAGVNQRLLYSARDNFTETVPALAAGYRVSDSLRVGLSVGVDVVSYDANDSLSTQATDTTSQVIFSRTSQFNFSSLNLLFGVGGQYDVSDGWKVSAAFKTPTFRITGGGKATVENIQTEPGSVTDTAFFDAEAEFEYIRPFMATFGVAYVSRDFELEANVRYHGKVSTYSMFKSDQPIVTTSNTGGAPTTSTAPLNDVQMEYRGVTNVAFGAKYRLSDAVSLHSGFFTSDSPIADGNSTIFRKVDLKGITLGAAVEIGPFSGSVGGAYEFGTSEPFQLPRATPGESVTTSVKATAFSILYALSFSL